MGKSVQNYGVMHHESAGICCADGIEIFFGDDDAATEVDDINLEVADGSSSWERMIEPIVRAPKMVRSNREFADDVPSPRAAELFANANKEHEAVIAAMAEEARSFWKNF